MEIKFDLKFAKWKVEQLKDELEMFYQTYGEDGEKYFGDKKYFYQRLGEIVGQIKVWKELCILLCPKHQWEEINNPLPEVYIEERICKNCGAIDDYYDSVYYAVENNTKGCHNCQYMEKSGGDWVPYGSTNVQLPEYSYCIAPVTENMEDEEHEEFLNKYAGEKSYLCPYWEGRIYKAIGKEE